MEIINARFLTRCNFLVPIALLAPDFYFDHINFTLNVGLPTGHAVGRLCRYACVIICGYVARRDMVIGHVSSWLRAVRRLSLGCCFHILCR